MTHDAPQAESPVRQHDNALVRYVSCCKCDYNLTDIDPTGNCPECGTPIINGCIWCEYDLSATDPSGNCPECGTPVECSMGRGALSNVPTDVLRSVHAGFKTVTVLILVRIITLVFLFVLMGYISFRSQQAAGYPLTAMIAFIGNAITFGIIFGWYKLTTPLRGLPGMLDAPDKRSFVRIALAIYAASLVVITVWQLFPHSSDPKGAVGIIAIVVGVIYLASFAILIVLFVADVLYLGWFAKLVRNRKMRKRARHFVWSGPLIAIVGFPVLFLGPLITLVLYWNMIEYIRRDLKKIIQARPES